MMDARDAPDQVECSLSSLFEGLEFRVSKCVLPLLFSCESIARSFRW